MSLSGYSQAPLQHPSTLSSGSSFLPSLWTLCSYARRVDAANPDKGPDGRWGLTVAQKLRPKRLHLFEWCAWSSGSGGHARIVDQEGLSGRWPARFSSQADWSPPTITLAADHA